MLGAGGAANLDVQMANGKCAIWVAGFRAKHGRMGLPR